MKKFDRVTSILIYLQTRSVVTAQELAERFEVSERTIYRDLRSLENAGVPIGAEAGVGYFLDKSYRLPPVMFTREEGSSLLLGAKMIETRVDPATRDDYKMALDKIRSVMESDDQHYLNFIDKSIAVFKPELNEKSSGHDNWLPQCRAALSRSVVVEVDYESGSSRQATTRVLEPIGLYYYNDHWHLIAWCRLRKDYRDFRLDRIKSFSETIEQFIRRDHATLQQYLESQSHRDLHEIVVTFTRDAARFVGEQRYHFGFVQERQTIAGIEITFVTPYLDYFGRWLLQFTSGASSEYKPLRKVMKALGAELEASWDLL